MPALGALAEVADVVAVVCQPDRPAGRGLALKAPPVKVKAVSMGIPVVQPEKIRTPELAAWMREQEADAALVIAYGRILPPAVLAAPRRGCLNLHASILPKYRGAAPITWALYHGETETGISFMQMDEGCDTGAVFTTHRLTISETMTADELGVALGALAAEVVRSDFTRVVAGEIQATPQDHTVATMAPILEKENGRIDWTRDHKAIHDHVRAMTSWPGAFTTVSGKTLKVLATAVGQEAASAVPGTIVRADKHGIVVACGTGTLTILRAQMEGKKPLGAAELVAGRTLGQGMLLAAR